ncbi:MAG: efflux RND transporter periplasmic adaptor subunit [Candidatus Merdivicinus sp.]|jgi:HlyD family secretion protein
MIFKKRSEDAQTMPLPGNSRKRKWLKILLILLAIIIAAALLLRGCLPNQAAKQAMSTSTYQYETVSRRDITMQLSYSGTLEPADSYEVTSLVSGEILDAPFEEGDILQEGDLLYSVDTSDAQNNIDRAELSLEQAQMNYDKALDSLEKLTIKAQESGTIISLDVEVGDEVQAGQQLGTLRNSSTMELRIPFNSADIANINVGDSATVTVDGSIETLTGIVSKIDAADEILTGGMLVRYVTIDVQNPGAISSGSSASAMIGSIACNSSGTFAYKTELPITAEVSGKVSSISAKEGSWLNKNAVILTLSSTELENSLRNSEISLEDSQLSLKNVQEQLEDYQITSPIAGTVIKKNYKAGDNLTTGTGNLSLCTIYDLSYLTMTLNVDELDISDIELGQKVSITADAVEGKVYEGEVTSISVQGTTSGGVTTYPVTIQIQETDGLLPGMNVDAEIIVDSAEQVLAIPTSAVQRGNKVLVSVESETGKAALEAQQSESSGEEASDSSIPEGYIYVDVELGLSNDDYIEITSGLAEGDEIAYAGGSHSSLTDMMMPMGGGEMVVMPSDGGNMSPPSGGQGGGPGGMGGRG